MLELSKKYCKAAIIKMLQSEIISKLETSEKAESLSKEIEKSQQRNRRYKEEPNGILKLNNTMPEIKNSLDGYNSRMDLKEKRISEFEDKTVEITQSEQLRLFLLRLFTLKKCTEPQRPMQL